MVIGSAFSFNFNANNFGNLDLSHHFEVDIYITRKKWLKAAFLKRYCDNETFTNIMVDIHITKIEWLKMLKGNQKAA